MSSIKVNTFFVSEKISKVRWIPEHEPDRFITGSWDLSTNYVRAWCLQQNQYADDYNEYVPQCTDKIAFKGDITGLEMITPEIAAVSCSDGRVRILKIKHTVDEDLLEEVGQSALLHKFNTDRSAASCSDISVYGKEIATVGEDGRVNLIDSDAASIVRRSFIADSCALNAVLYVRPQELLTANRMGIIRMFDIRTAIEDLTPTTSFMATSEDEKLSNYISCLTAHPTQPHVVLAGSEEGSITVWDMRQLGYPASYLSAHNSAITEIKFHRMEPSKAFTASDYGELWLWAQHLTMNITGYEQLETSDNVNPWLSGERTKNRISVTSLISNLRKPINSVDACGSKVICGSDSEAVYFIDNLF